MHFRLFPVPELPGMCVCVYVSFYVHAYSHCDTSISLDTGSDYGPQLTEPCEIFPQFLRDFHGQLVPRPLPMALGAALQRVHFAGTVASHTMAMFIDFFSIFLPRHIISFIFVSDISIHFGLSIILSSCVCV